MQLDSRLYSLIVLLAVLASVTALLMTHTVEGDTAKGLLAVFGMALAYVAPSPIFPAPVQSGSVGKSAVQGPQS